MRLDCKLERGLAAFYWLPVREASCFRTGRVLAILMPCPTEAGTAATQWIGLRSKRPLENLCVQADRASKSTIGKQHRTMKKASMSVYPEVGTVDLMARGSLLSGHPHIRTKEVCLSEHSSTPRKGKPFIDISVVRFLRSEDDCGDAGRIW